MKLFALKKDFAFMKKLLLWKTCVVKLHGILIDEVFDGADPSVDLT